MGLESTLRKVATRTALFGAAAYLTLSAIACSGGAAPTVTPTPSTPPAATAPATPTPRKPEETPTPQPYNTATPTATATPPQQPPTVTPRPPTPTATPTATATPIVGLTQEQLTQKLSGLEEILRANEPALDADGKDYKGYVAKITDAVDAGYYLATGRTRTWQSDSVSPLFLTKKDFDAFIDTQLPYTTEVKDNFKKNYASFAWKSVDLKTGKTKYLLVMRGDLPTNFVFEEAAHESGQALGNILNPNIRNTTLGSLVLGEASQQAFSYAIYKASLAFTGKKFNYTLNDENLKFIDDEAKYFQALLNVGPNARNFPEFAKIFLLSEVNKKGFLKPEGISAQESYELFKSLVMDDAEADKYLNAALSSIPSNIVDIVRQNAVARLIPNYPVDKQGPISNASVIREKLLLGP